MIYFIFGKITLLHHFFIFIFLNKNGELEWFRVSEKLLLYEDIYDDFFLSKYLHGKFSDLDGQFIFH